MGLLALGTPLPWSEAKQHADYVREHGIEQLLHIWHNLKDRTGDRLLWGDEVSPHPPPFLDLDLLMESEEARDREGWMGALWDRGPVSEVWAREHGSVKASAETHWGRGEARTWGNRKEPRLTVLAASCTSTPCSSTTTLSRKK
jgi:hypothetical protein